MRILCCLSFIPVDQMHGASQSEGMFRDPQIRRMYCAVVFQSSVRQRRAYSESTRPDERGRSRGHRRENRATTTTPEEEGDMMTMIIMIKKHLFISFIYKFKAEPVFHFLLLFPEAVGFCSMRGTGSGSFPPILHLANTCPPGKRPAAPSRHAR